MGIGAKRQQSINIINRMIAENADVTAEAIIAAHVAEMYPDKPNAAVSCYRLTLAEQPDLVKGAPALVAKPRGAKPAAPATAESKADEAEVPSSAEEKIQELKAAFVEALESGSKAEVEAAMAVETENRVSA